MNVPFVVPEDDTTPYPADFERVVAGIRDMGYALDVIEEGRAGGAIFDVFLSWCPSTRPGASCQFARCGSRIFRRKPASTRCSRPRTTGIARSTSRPV